MHWGCDASIMEHVGIVKEVTGKYVVTYEGNTSLANQANGGGVMERNRALSTSPGHIGTGTTCKRNRGLIV